MDGLFGNTFFTGNIRDFPPLKIDFLHQLTLGGRQSLHRRKQPRHVLPALHLVGGIRLGYERRTLVLHAVKGNMAAGFLMVVVVLLAVKIQQHLSEGIIHLDLGDFPCYKFIADFQSAALLPEPGRTQNVVIFTDIKRSFLYAFVKLGTL